jgi:hypothetical protein
MTITVMTLPFRDCRNGSFRVIHDPPDGGGFASAGRKSTLSSFRLAILANRCLHQGPGRSLLRCFHPRALDVEWMRPLQTRDVAETAQTMSPLLQIPCARRRAQPPNSLDSVPIAYVPNRNCQNPVQKSHQCVRVCHT